jgi:hypothetical protein
MSLNISPQINSCILHWYILLKIVPTVRHPLRGYTIITVQYIIANIILPDGSRIHWHYRQRGANTIYGSDSFGNQAPPNSAI